MLILITILIAIVLFASIRLYSGDDKRLPPTSTKRGRQARVVIGSVLACYLVLLILDLVGKGANRQKVVFWVGVFALGASVPIFRYIQFEKKK